MSLNACVQCIHWNKYGSFFSRSSNNYLKPCSFHTVNDFSLFRSEWAIILLNCNCFLYYIHRSRYIHIYIMIAFTNTLNRLFSVLRNFFSYFFFVARSFRNYFHFDVRVLFCCFMAPNLPPSYFSLSCSAFSSRVTFIVILFILLLQRASCKNKMVVVVVDVVVAVSRTRAAASAELFYE